jgi:hypothetical protein
MSVELTVRSEENWLVIEGVGVIANAADEKSFASSCYEEIIKHGARRALVDLRKIDFRSSIFDQVDVVSHYNKEFDSQIRTVRITLVVDPKHKDLHDFWEVYANNRGYPWKVFTEMEAATAFLQQD